ncbi:sensor histidine kinase [Argonema galeatum]|uniref:sensor histidine kinase n=1 Tax=Argonema galeatum TaxID=2942762 RepID=UPI00201246EC|nr:ATP-binding protein [Argonema galeatum]MCL1463685.1 GAF domain-containing protein [Argonema galeatum A003/A1]
MSLPINFQKRLSNAPVKSASAWQSNPSGLQELGAQLAFTQNASGQYLSFYWQEAELYDLHPEAIASSPLSETFSPAAIGPYLERLQQILANRVPEHLNCQFHYKEHTFSFDLVISPILMPDGTATKVLVMGSQVQGLQEGTSSNKASGAAELTPTLGSEVDVSGELCHRLADKLSSSDDESDRSCKNYQKLLSKISRNIRRTLDLDTIWQQAVDDLGQGLDVASCIICPYKSPSEEVKIVAEYRQESVRSQLGQKLKLNKPFLTKALTTLEPLVVEQELNSEDQQDLILVVATCYQNQPNGLIRLARQNSLGNWTAEEIELVREIADQVGTALAHATLYKELEQARQEAEEASRLKSEFLANTSHELRTPLNGMLGFLKLIMEGMTDDPEEQMEFIEEAYRSAIHLLNIINDILDIAKIEAGKMELELGQVDLDEVLSDVEDFTKTQAVQKKLSFRIQRPPTRDKIIIYGNYQRLLQVMLNLVGNAIKFTHEGGVLIAAEIVRKKVMVQNQELPGTVKVRVIDTGIGVSLEKQDRLFQSFSQVDGSRTRQYGGTGLGLTISQKLIEAMKGVVNFYSLGEGLGSTVTFTVPLYQDVVMVSEQQTDGLDALM